MLLITILSATVERAVYLLWQLHSFRADCQFVQRGSRVQSVGSRKREAGSGSQTEDPRPTDQLTACLTVSLFFMPSLLIVAKIEFCR